MPRIRENEGVITQVNVFECLPENQAALIELLNDAAQAVSDIDGWISASIHRNAEGTRVVNYAQCRDMASWEQVMKRLWADGWIERNKALGTAHPGLYEVVVTIEK